MVKMGQKRKGRKQGIKRKQIKLYPLDIMFSRYIRSEADYTCEYCGVKHASNSKGMHTSHFISRTYRMVRWDKRNVACLCFGCHRFMESFPALHRDFFVKRIGAEGIEQLEILARSGQKPDLVAIKADLERKLKGV